MTTTTDPAEEIHRTTAAVLSRRRQYLETLAAAYALATDLDPTEVELVEEHKEWGITWHFRRREQPETSEPGSARYACGCPLVPSRKVQAFCPVHLRAVNPPASPASPSTSP